MKKQTNKTLSVVLSFFVIAQLFAPFSLSLTLNPKINSNIAYAGDTSQCQLYPDNAPDISSDYGGVELSMAAEFLADMSDIVGAYYDDDTNRIVFVGTTTTELPEFNKDDLAVAIRAIMTNGSIPAVSIERKNPSDPDYDDYQDVIFSGGIENTNLGQTLLEADLMLKQYFMGYDESQATITSSVIGYESGSQRFIDYGPDLNKNGYSRYWISPQEVSIRESTSTNAFIFENVVMQVETESLIEDPDPAWIDASEDFVEHHTEYFDDFAEEIPSYAKTKQLAKIVGVIKWIKDNGIVSNFEWVEDYNIIATSTPEELPVFYSPELLVGTSTFLTISGGVGYSIANTYETDTQGTSTQLEIDSEAAASTTDSIHWTFSSDGETYDAVAISTELLKSAGAYAYGTKDTVIPTISPEPLILTRSYSSFAKNKDIGFGPGWEFYPASMKIVAPNPNSTCTYGSPYNVTFEVPDRIAVTTPDNGRETFTFTCGGPIGENYSADDDSYHSEVFIESNGSNKTTYTIETKFGNKYTFYGESATTSDFKLLRYDNRLTNPLAGDNDYVREYKWDSSTSTLLTIQDIREDQTASSTFNGSNLAFNYNGNGNISSVVSPRGTTTYSYDGNGDLVGVVDMRGAATTYTYSDHLLESITDRGGTTFIQNEYDSLGRVATQTNAYGLVKTIDYDDDNLEITWSDENDRTGSSKYDHEGRVIQTEDPSSAVTSFVYDSSYTDEPTKVINAEGATTTFAYNSSGNLTSVTDPNGGQVSYTWDSANNLTQISDSRYTSILGSPRIIKFTYNSYNNLTQSSIDGQGTTTYSYTPQGLVATTTDSNGDTLEYFYNDQGLTTKLRDQLNNDIDYTYNGAGYLTEITDPIGATTTYSYDANGNVLTSTNSFSVITNTYDANDRLLSVVNPVGATTTFAYNIAGKLATTTDAFGESTHYHYDQYSNLKRVTDALSRDTEYTYDSLNRETVYELASGKTYTTQYDILGNPTATIEPNGTAATSTYDSLNRLISQEINNQVFSYTYDSAGRIKTLTGDSGTTTYTYDSRDRIIEVEDPYDVVIEYEYDDLSNITKITYPDDKTVDNEYNEAGQLTKQTDWNNDETTYTYTDSGSLSTTTLPNGVTTKRNYDAVGRLSSIVHRDSSQNIIFRQIYTRDANGNITEIDEDGDEVSTDEVTYSYDLIGRLIGSDSVALNSSYHYDEVGNIVETNQGTATTTFSHTIDNELSTSTATSSGTGGPGPELIFFEQELGLMSEEIVESTTTDTEAITLPKTNTDNEPTNPENELNIEEVIEETVPEVDVATTTNTETATESDLESNAEVATTTDTTIPPKTEETTINKPTRDTKLTADGLIKNSREAEVWRRYHEERVAYLKQNTAVSADKIIKAEHAQNKYETYLIDYGFIKNKEDKIDTLSYQIKQFFFDTIKSLTKALLPNQVYAYLFDTEDFETCGSLPCSLDADTSWGSVTTSLDSGGQIEGDDSLKTVVTGEGGGAIETTNYDTDEIYAQFKVYIPSSFAWGTSGYFTIFRTEDTSNGSVVWMSVEDYGTPRLTVMGDVLGYTDTGIDLTEGAVNTIEIRIKTGSSTGDLDVWINNDTEGSPDYNGSGTMNLGTDNVDDILFGLNYVPETGLSTTYYDDLVVDDSFIGSLATSSTNATPTAPTNLKTEGETNPTDITDATPEFTATYNDPDIGDIATHYQLQVATSTNFTAPYWDSTKTAMATTTTGSTTPTISYAGSTLASSTTYYWRIKFFDDEDAEGAWSTTTATFSLDAGGSTSTATTTSYTIYDNSLHSDWTNWSWDTTVDFGHSVTVQNGTDAIEADYTASWGGLNFHTTLSNGFDASAYESLNFWVHGGGTAGQSVYLYFTDESSTDRTSVLVGDYITGGIAANEWKEVAVPIEDIEADEYAIDQLIFMNSTGTTLYLDEVEFVGATSSETDEGETTYTYDNSGNLLSATNNITTKTFTWNSLGLLNTAVINNTVANFTYDSAGNRIAKAVNTGAGTTTTRYINDTLAPNALVLAEANASNTIERYNLWGPNGLVSTGEAGSTERYYPLTDHHGSVRLLTDVNGNVVNKYTYTPYGEVTTLDDQATTTPYLYTSEQFDEETGLIYLRARYYDPQTGRFISRDPFRGTLDTPLSQHAYQYAFNNPNSYIDPSGETALIAANPYLLAAGAAISAISYLASTQETPEFDIFVPAKEPPEVHITVPSNLYEGMETPPPWNPNDWKPPHDNQPNWKKAIGIGIGAGVGIYEYAGGLLEQKKKDEAYYDGLKCHVR